MEDLIVWIARDRDESLCIFLGKPIKDGNYWQPHGESYKSISDSLFPEITWEDEEPTQFKLVKV